jgi:hypothetical protein
LAVKQVFTQLSSLVKDSGKLEHELLQKGKALARFGQFDRLWGAKHLSLATKVLLLLLLLQLLQL